MRTKDALKKAEKLHPFTDFKMYGYLTGVCKDILTVAGADVEAELKAGK